MSNKYIHSHSLIWTVLISCFGLIVLLLLFLCMKGHINYAESSISSDALIGIIATFIGVCTALMLGAQIYSVYNRTQIEREYDEKLNEITTWFKTSTSEYERKLEAVNGSIRNFEKLKHSVNDALAGIHYNEGKLLEGILNVLDNVVILTNNQEPFCEELIGKADFAIYAIAKNLKEYKNDITVKKEDIRGYIHFSNKWKVQYELIDFSSQCGKHIMKRMNNLNTIVNKLTDNILAFKFKVGMEKDHLAILNEYARD